MNKTDLQKRQARDLRTRYDNLVIKLDIAKSEAKERERECRATLAAKDAEIAMVQKTNAKTLREKDKTISMLQKAVVSHDAEYAMLKEENARLKEENERLSEGLEKANDMADTLRASLKKDSSTSSKAPSSDEYKKPHVFSTREKSGRKPGGQKGHKGHTLAPAAEPTAIINRLPVDVCGCGGAVSAMESYTPKQLIDLKITIDVIEERAYEGRCGRCGKIHKGVFSEGFANPVQYGPGVKAIVASLNAYCNTTVGKTAEFIKSVTSGKVAMSGGTVVNILHGLSGRLDGTVEAIRQGLLAGKAMNIDETGMRTGGRLAWAQIFSNDGFSLFLRNVTRGAMPDAGSSLLAIFAGILAHDHFKPYYRLSHLKHAECNVHILRALLAVINILKHGWAQEMSKFLTDTNKMKKARIAAGDRQVGGEEAAGIEKRYLEILDQGDAEYEAAIAGKKSVAYYNDERLLLKRLREYKDEHLLFIMDFDAPFGNNNAEQGAKFLKSKLRCAGCFRSEKGADDYARAASLIATLRKQNINVFETIKGLFEGAEPSFATSVEGVG